MSTTSPSPGPRCTPISASRTRACRARSRSTSRAVEDGAGRARCAHRQRRPGRERRLLGAQARRAGLRLKRRCTASRPADLRRRRRDARAGPPGGGAGQDRVSRPRLILDVPPRRQPAAKLVTEPLKLERGDVAAGLAKPAPAEGLEGGDRRAGPLLPRKPDRARHPRRGRGHAGATPRPSIRAKSSTWSRRCSASRMR
jgi:hypothetical protein